MGQTPPAQARLAHVDGEHAPQLHLQAPMTATTYQVQGQTKPHAQAAVSHIHTVLFVVS